MKIAGLEPNTFQPMHTDTHPVKDEAKPFARNPPPGDGGGAGGMVRGVAGRVAQKAHQAINVLHRMVDPKQAHGPAAGRLPVGPAHVGRVQAAGMGARREAALLKELRSAAASLYHQGNVSSARFTAPDAKGSTCQVMSVRDPVNGEVRIIRNVGSHPTFSMMKIYKDSVGDIHVRWKDPKTGNMLASHDLRGEKLEQARALALAALNAPRGR